ncbi:MAG: condensation domain-containing protein, partial [Actinomycetota bacterium]|nr:condensation domain-containing protein [Actinomycetota bacterium]
MSFSVNGSLRVSAFKRAWRQVIQRHPILRTGFYWEEMSEPLQVVYRQAELAWVEEDWRGLSSGEQQGRLQAFLQADRAQGFELDQAPLMRCALLRVGEAQYYFVLSFHHLLLDGWSLPQVLKEVMDFYAAYCGGRELHLTSPRPYRDYIAWLQRQDLSRAEAYWREALRGITAPTPLPIGRNVGARVGQVLHYAEHEWRVSAAVTERLQGLARAQRLTLNTLVQGTWALLLSRYSGEDDVLFGATVSGRPAELGGVEAMVGLFINTLAVRVKLPAGAGLLGWLEQLQAEQVEREQYAYSPLVEVQGWSEVPRGVPLFESLVVFENYPVDEALAEQRNGVEFREVQAVERTNYPLTVAAATVGAELGFKVIYDSDRFEHATIKRLGQHFETLLRGIVEDSRRSLADIPLLPPAEREQVLVAWNQTQAAYPREQCIHQLFEAQAHKTPDAMAVVYEDQGLSYGALNARANQLAHHLRGLGVGPEVRVGICVERSLELVVGLLGVLKAGGAYVPLDPSYPQARLAFMLEDAKVMVLLSQAHLTESLPETAAAVLYLDAHWPLIAQQSPTDPVNLSTPLNLAYVIYTSGSTGIPKGVLVPHKGLLNLVFWHQDAFAVTSSARATQLAGTAFDASVWEIWPYLSKGASLYIVRREILGSSVSLR